MEMEMKKKGELGVIGMMLTVEIILVSCSTITKAAMTFGMSNLVFFVYFRLLAILLLLPTCFFLYRKARLPKMAVSTAFRLFLLAFLNYFGMWIMFKGLGYSSPTLVSAIANLGPAFTFILALLFRMETLNLSEKSSLFKLAGTVILVSGGFIIVFYQGLPITFSRFSSDSGLLLQPPSTGGNWAVGGVLLLASTLAYSTSFIVKIFGPFSFAELAQSYPLGKGEIEILEPGFSPATISLHIGARTRASRDYPFEMMATLICTTFEAVIAVVVAAFEEKDQSSWRLRLNIVSIAIFSSAILMVGVVSPVQLWVSRKKGPVFLAMFTPLQMIIAMALGVTTLGYTLHIGSVIGGAVIAIGFYTVMKGKSMEDESSEDGGGTSPELAALLQSKNMNV